MAPARIWQKRFIRQQESNLAASTATEVCSEGCQEAAAIAAAACIAATTIVTAAAAVVSADAATECAMALIRTAWALPNRSLRNN